MAMGDADHRFSIHDPNARRYHPHDRHDDSVVGLYFLGSPCASTCHVGRP